MSGGASNTPDVANLCTGQLMKILSHFDPSRHRLGSLCKRGHDWQNTGKSPRRIGSNSCIVCDLNRSGVRKLVKDYVEETKKAYPEIDANKYFLGSLCKRKHQWNETEQSLRYVKTGSCLKCIQITSDTTRKQKQSEYNARARRNRLLRLDASRAYSREYARKYRKLLPIRLGRVYQC